MANFITPKKVKVPKLNFAKLRNLEEKDMSYDPKKQVEGYEKRLEASGIDPDKATDSRNFLEKALNLEEDQNILFDIFEVLERPQQALFGAIQAKQKGKNVGKAALEHFKGNEHTYGKDLLIEGGVVSDSKDKFGVDDLLGLALDIVADPIDLALIPATGGAKLIGDAQKAVDSTQDIYNTAKLLNNADAITSAEKALKKAQDYLNGAKKVQLRTIRSLAGRGFKAGLRKTGTIADTGISKILKYADNRSLEKVAKAKELGMTGYIKQLDALDKYEDFKKYLTGIFKPDKRLPKGIWNRIFKINSAEMLSKSETAILSQKMVANIDEYAQVVGRTSEEVGEDIMTAIEYFKYNPKGAYIDFIRSPQQALDQQAYEAIQPLFKSVGIKADDVYEHTLVNGKDAYLVKNIDMHKQFVKDIDEKFLDTTSDLSKMEHAHWERRLKSNINGNYFARMKNKGAHKITTEAKEALNNDIQVLVRGWIDNPTHIDRITRKNAIYDVFEKHGLNSVLDSGDLNFEKLDNYIQTIVDDKRIVARYANEDTLLPRFKNAEKEARLQELLQKDKAFSDLVDKSYEFKVAIEETYGRIFDDVLGGSNLRLRMTEGIVHHTETDEMKRMRGVTKLFPDYEDSPVLRGKRSLLATRDYKVSADEANAIFQEHMDMLHKYNVLKEDQIEFLANHEGMKLFKNTIQESVADMMEYTPKLTKDTKMMEEILATSWLYDSDLIRPYTPSNPKVDFYQHKPAPPGYQIVNRNDLIKELNGYKNYLGENSAVDKLIEGLKSGNYNTTEVLIESNIHSMIGALVNQKETKAFMNFMDAANSLFKQTKLLSPGFQVRNILGNSFNMYAAGMPIRKIVSNFTKAHTVISKGDDVLRKVTEGVALTAKEQKIWKWYKPFIENNFHELSRKMFDPGMVDKTVDKIAELEGIGAKAKKPFKKVVELNSKGNQFSDERFRLALYMFASENPSILTKFGADDPATLVRKVLFDPNDLSWAEKKHLRKFIPFYTFTKKNLVYQWENLPQSSKAYQSVQKSIRDTWKAMELEPGEDVDQYKLEDFWIPIPKLGKDGKYRAIRAKLPIEDLGELLENPLRKFVAASAPLLRAPYEFAANQQLFTGMPIEEFKGQRGYMIPEISRKAEYLLSQTGLDIPIAGIADVGKASVGLAKGDYSDLGQFAQAAVGRSVIGEGTAERSRTTKAYSELDEIRELMKYYKQEGIDIVKLSDIENKSPLNNLVNRLKQINSSFR